MFTSKFCQANILINIPSARLVKWVTESNRPTTIVHDRELEQLLTAGRPHINLPSEQTVSRDVNAYFKKSRERIKQLLKVCSSLNRSITNINNPYSLGPPRTS